MKRIFALLPVPLFLGACAGDNHTTQQSPQQPSRYVRQSSAGDLDHPAGSRTVTTFSRNRVYQITRLETADQPRGEWRALGSTIRQSGSTITFSELGSGREISFTAPHQITPTNSVGNRGPTDSNSEIPAVPEAPSPAR